MYKFLLYQFEMGHITAKKLRTYVPRWITEDQYNEIVGGGE